MSVVEILRRLEAEYGHRPWRPHGDPISELVRTILSQHTSDVNSHRAFDRLRQAFANWDAVADAPPDAIAQAIWPGGLARMKAPRIKKMLTQIRERNGSLELDFLAPMPVPEAERWLQQLPGVGPKTASCVLLFSWGMPALPVDTHVHRVAQRLGLIEPRTPAGKAQDILEGLVPQDMFYHFHMSLIQHGRRVCHARRPGCEKCALADLCPSCGTYGAPVRSP